MKKFIKKFCVTVQVPKKYNNSVYDNVNCYAYIYEKCIHKHWYFPFGEKIKKLYVKYDIPYSCDTYRKPYPYDEWVYDDYLRKRNNKLKHEGEDVLKEQIIEYGKLNNIDYFE